MAEPTIMPKFVVIEIRTNDDGSISDTVTSFTSDDRAHAENKYHAVLAAASISEKPIHACVLMTAEGNVIAHQRYLRGAALPTE